MTRDGAYINHNDYDQQQGIKDISEKIYEDTKKKMRSDKTEKDTLEDPMMEAIRKEEHPIRKKVTKTLTDNNDSKY
jgi:hypothetical protein